MSQPSCGSVPGGEATIMQLLRETHSLVKQFDARLQSLEVQVAELGPKKGTTSRTQEKAAVTDEIRVRPFFYPGNTCIAGYCANTNCYPVIC